MSSQPVPQPSSPAMAAQRPLSNVAYDPLPLTNEHGDIVLHSAIPEEFHTPSFDPRDLPRTPDEADIAGSTGASTPVPPQPRFLGQALYDGSASRDSYASSHGTTPSQRGTDYDNSLYALNQTSGAAFNTPYRDDPRGSGTDYFARGTPDAGRSSDQLPMSPVGQHSRFLTEKQEAYLPPRTRSRRRLLIWGGLAGLSLLIIAIIVPVYFTVIKKNNNLSSSGSSSSGGSGGSKTSSSGAASPTSTSTTSNKFAISGGDGSTVTMDDGTTFTYSNSFGGTWYYDPENPLVSNAKAQSWTPALNETFTYGVDRIWGVNLGGWLVTEPFIVPALYEPYVNATTPAVDEWTLSENMAADTANGGLNQLENHYATFITEQDFAEIAGAGLNFVRIPLPYWAIEVREGEPFLAKVAWTYFLKAIQWARKYGIRINLDFHALPGSQNGWNHSGKLGSINVLNGPMGLANAQRSLDYIRIIAEFISQPEYSDIVSIFGITNEPEGPVVGQPALSSYYLQAYNFVRQASGYGAGKGPVVSYHDGFLSEPQWAGFLPNADRISLDTHPYLCFGGQSAAPMSSYATTPCATWGAMMNTSMGAFGLTTAGEWSNAVTDCGEWVNGVNQGTRYEGTFPGFAAVGSCTEWTDWQSYDATMKQSINQFAMASMDALQNWFFWTWKIGNSSISGTVESPSWSYQLGLQNGWMPTDPRTARGVCGNTSPWSGELAPSQLGTGGGAIAASATATLPWPPAEITGGAAGTAMPSYTPTGAVPTLPPPTFTNTASQTVSASVGDGWENPSDTAGAMVAIASCSYLNPWIGPAAVPSPLCSGAAKREPVPVPEPTMARRS